jgi:hypothetical protein
MEIDGNFQLFSSRKNWPEEPVIEVTSPIVPVDDRSFEAMVPDHAFQFFCSVIRSCGRQRRKSSKALWIFNDCMCEEVVCLLGHSNRWGSFQLFQTRRSQREDLHMNAGFVHLGNSLFSQVRELIEQAGGSVAKLQGSFFELLSRSIKKPGAGKMFL